MKALRIWEGQQLVFDAQEEVLKRKRNKVLVRMMSQNSSYTTDFGVRFRKSHPFQWIDKEEVDFLLGSTEPEFKLATFEQAQDYYLS